MLDLVTTSFYIKAPSFERDDFARYSTDLFDEWDKYIESNLQIPDYAVTLTIEEGSIKGRGKIAAALGALYLGIANYGGFVSGVQTIHAQASYVTKALFEQAKQHFGCKSELGNSKQTGGEIYYLGNLFDRVQRGQLTANQAMAEVQDRWEHEAENSPEFLKDLAAGLNHAPRHPEQLTLLDELSEPCAAFEVPLRQPTRKLPRLPEPPIPQHYRIEIFRPRKGGDKKIKLTKIK